MGLGLDEVKSIRRLVYEILLDEGIIIEDNISEDDIDNIHIKAPTEIVSVEIIEP
jgi:hypothetical protein